MRRRPRRSLLKAVAPLIVAGTLTVAATAAAAGFDPAPPNPLPDSAFAPVAVPTTAIPTTAIPTTAIGDAAGELPMRAARSAGVVPDADRVLTTEILGSLAAAQPERPQPSVREPDRIAVDIKPITTHVIRGPASWYCRAGVSPCTNTNPDLGGLDAYAAAGPKLRAAIGPSWRGTIIYVDGIRVQLIDWCQCYKGERHEKLLDLYYDVYARTGSAVTIRW